MTETLTLAAQATTSTRTGTRPTYQRCNQHHSYGEQSSQSQKCHIHAIRDIEINFVGTPLQWNLPPITFRDRDFKGINPINQDDPMVVSIIIANFMVSKVLINQGSSTDILYWKNFQGLEVSSDTVHPHTGPFVNFTGKRVKTKGYVNLTTTFGQGWLSMNFTIRYILVDGDTSYFALISRKTLNELEAIVSTPHLKMKFPTLTRKILTDKANQKQAWQCYAESLKVEPYPPTMEPAKPYPTATEGTQVMSIDKRSPYQALTVFQPSLDDEFDIDLQDDTSDRDPKPIVNLQLRPKPVCSSVGTSLIMSIGTSPMCYTKLWICLLGSYLTCKESILG